MEEWEVKIHAFLIMAVDPGKWSASHPGCFISAKESLVHIK